MSSRTAYTAFYTMELRETIAHLSHKALRVYVLLATYADPRGVCYPSVKELAERSGLHVESVIEAMRELEGMALMCYLRRNEKDPITGKAIPNVYLVSGCLMRKTDSDFSEPSEHEPIRSLVLKSESTNEVTNYSNQESENQLHAPPPSTKKPRLKAEKQTPSASTMRNDADGDEKQGQKQPRQNSAAGTAPQNSKSQHPPIPAPPPLPAGFDADAEMLDPDNETAARWLCSEAMTRRDGGEVRAAMSMANARRYIARYDRWRIRAALNLARRDPATRSVIGRMDYLLRTSVAAEAQQLQDEMYRLYGDDAASGE